MGEKYKLIFNYYSPNDYLSVIKTEILLSPGPNVLNIELFDLTSSSWFCGYHSIFGI